MKFYILKEPCDFWGDYSHILMHGMAVPEDLKNGPLLLYRTAPYIPPISFPGIGDVVVTDEFKIKMERSGLKGFSFRPVIKKHIVRLDWHNWDKTTDDPPEFPNTGEPEDYIEEKPHSPALAEDLGPLWEVIIEDSATVHKVKLEASITGLVVYLVASSWNGDDAFRAYNVRHIYLTVKARDWFKSYSPEYVLFNEAKIGE